MKPEEIPLSVQKRFWAKVLKSEISTDCWEWQSSRNSLEYGVFAFNVKSKRYHWRAHRLAWTLTNGKIPEGLFVCHSCDNRSCVNPNHLWLGTAQDNTSDMVQKNRHAKGFANGFGTQYRGKRPDLTRRNLERHGKLTDADVSTIKDLRKQGMTYTAIAKLFGVSEAYVSRLVRGLRRNN